MAIDHDEELVTALRTASRTLAAGRSIRDLDETLRHVVATAVATVPGVDAGSISMVEDGRVATHHPTSERIRKLDDRQIELGEGPCITAIDDAPASGIVLAEDFAGVDADRWPRFSREAISAGCRAALSTQVSTDGGLRASLNLYSAGPCGLDGRSLTMAGLFGAQVALLLYGADQAQHLQRAIASRDLIGRAKGILAERFHVDDDTAFEMLVSSSQETNIKLTTVAQWLTENTKASGPRPPHGTV
jgi:hypothetical protein